MGFFFLSQGESCHSSEWEFSHPQEDVKITEMMMTTTTTTTFDVSLCDNAYDYDRPRKERIDGIRISYNVAPE